MLGRNKISGRTENNKVGDYFISSNNPRIFLRQTTGIYFLLWHKSYSGLGHLLVEVLRSHRHTTLSKTLDKGSACCRDLYLTTHNIRQIKTSRD
jgi:hypothetical protein